MRVPWLVCSLAGLSVACIPELYTQGPVVNGANWEAPDNGWAMGEPPAELNGSGFDPGEVPPDFRLLDQNGDEVSLWQFYGQVVLLDVSTMWCAPCRDIAEHTQETQDDYEADGFVYLTVLQQDVDGDIPTREDVVLWADQFGITTSPIVGDDEVASGTAGAIRNGQYPSVLLLGRDLEVVERVTPPTDEAIRDAIESEL